jgi:hypothetical protein
MKERDHLEDQIVMLVLDRSQRKRLEIVSWICIAQGRDLMNCNGSKLWYC